VSLFGCTDTYYFTKWSEGGTPWDGFDELWKHSPLKYANNFKTPTLLLQNERDYRCPVEQAEQMLTALIERGVPCRMVLFHNASHSVMKPSQKMINDREIISWLDKYVK
jgi:acylaminoacyl-peptidase